MIKENISKIRERISLICGKIQQDPGRITVVAVTKGKPIGQIQEAAASGITDIGENRIQEAEIKYRQYQESAIAPPAIKWHLVGHLQTNKVKQAIKIFDLIHSVDSIKLAVEIDRQAARINKIQDILLEVKTSPEETKFGIAPDAVPDILKEVSGFKNIKVKGLMTIAPMVDSPQKSRPYFRRLRQIRDQINHLTIHQLTVLSMGMSDDFEVAIEEGANMVRLGRAIFESAQLRE